METSSCNRESKVGQLTQMLTKTFRCQKMREDKGRGGDCDEGVKGKGRGGNSVTFGVNLTIPSSVFKAQSLM